MKIKTLIINKLFGLIFHKNKLINHYLIMGEEHFEKFHKKFHFEKFHFGKVSFRKIFNK